MLFRVLGSNRDMEDLVQDAFIQIFRSVGSYRGESSLARWCCTIAMRTAYAAIDKRRRTPSGDDSASELEDRGPGLADRLDVHLAAARLYRALERIDDKHRVAFALAVLDERPLQEVAELTESSVSAVKTRVFRARKELLRRAAKDPVLSTYLGQLPQEDAP